MEIELLSSEYSVKLIEEADIQKVYDLCKRNLLYYQHCPPLVTADSIKEDLMALPKGKTLEDKYYVGFYANQTLVAVMDIISGYPNAETVFIGFFMMNQQMQGKGIGTAIIAEACRYFKKEGFAYVRLGFAKGNPQSEAFWTKNHFQKTGTEVQAKGYVIIVMQRYL